MSKIEEKAEKYAQEEIEKLFPTADSRTKTLLMLLLKQAYIEGASNYEDLTLEKVEVLEKLLKF